MSYLLLFVLFSACKMSHESCAGAEKSAEQIEIRKGNLEVQAASPVDPKL